MLFESFKSILYSDTLLPDIFISEYLPSMDGDYVKVYLYSLFLSKYNRQASTEELSKTLGIDLNKVKEALIYLESTGVITRGQDNVTLVDLKEKEIKKIYRLKATSTPEEAILSSERNKKRNSIITAINNMFFQGCMSPSWYTDIDAWFDRYKFDEDVMLALFKHCYDHKGLTKHYISKVADNWSSKSIKDSFDLDRYFIEYQKLKDIRFNIIKKLKLSRNLTEYEDEYIEKWVVEYKYDFSIIELALKKTTTRTNPTFKNIHNYLTEWYEKGLRGREDIISYEKDKKQTVSKKQAKDTPLPQHENFKQRKYDEEYYDNLYENVGN